MDNLIAKLYRAPKTVLTTEDLALIWEESDPKKLNAKTAYYAKQGALTRLTRGVFSKEKNYNPKELATSLYTPSYISFETVLREVGVIFQHYDTIFVAGKWPKTLTINKQAFIFRKLKDTVLYNPTGVVNKESYSIATLERAFLDMIYLFPDYYFDNLQPLNWEQCAEIVKIYNNKQLVKRLNKYRESYA
ncbi:hypothetical protein A2291_03705 [candidate division WOR-1 bacterium RIFOXYB2_FULL_42_35]|uniref:Transcriptional regulator n=1 Tax=candidate division WOR-1 bacterium RIFOXYC2_FULL_41_25 TaxID=1802586 RepID=A0A1F4TR40_UNCSA|nr:MAG: hypothetical protein A2247_03275 [candidate division WOR-1 bacterium RIFOXYA2_FULL_41_14]OGC25568.1 MAG: hypothetical protein A2291_03705 [candidate division WOR-1 bacterium RIFOXYB2_FULL_42_35]OGC35000.1 MAG: hypothetical protein A2462_05335 [candidate division WOR-1 bacterium RIFOXYC2_FULL_41_25]